MESPTATTTKRTPCPLPVEKSPQQTHHPQPLPGRGPDRHGRVPYYGNGRRLPTSGRDPSPLDDRTHGPTPGRTVRVRVNSIGNRLRRPRGRTSRLEPRLTTHDVGAGPTKGPPTLWVRVGVWTEGTLSRDIEKEKHLVVDRTEDGQTAGEGQGRRDEGRRGEPRDGSTSHSHRGPESGPVGPGRREWTTR